MPLSNDQVTKIARLARLNLTPDEIARFSHELTIILKYIDQLRQVDTTAVSPGVQSHENAGRLREDTVVPSLPQAQALQNAPEAKGGFLVVPKVLP